MSEVTKEVREANRSFAWGMTETGGNLLLLALMFGGSAFLIQWGVWFLVVGWVASSVVSRGADAVDWGWSKFPDNPFKKDPKK